MAGGSAHWDELADVHAVVAAHLVPAAAALELAAATGDPDAVRAYALEIVVVASSVAAACPRAEWAVAPTPAAPRLTRSATRRRAARLRRP